MKHRIGFALGNLVPALVLGLGCYSLPLRWWGVDAPVLVAVIVVLASSVAALNSERLALRALKLGALTLLVVGLGLLAAFALCVAFLSGIHGAFGTFGRLLMVLAMFLLAPYTVAYPAFALWLLGRSRAPLGSADRAGTVAEGRASDADVAVGASSGAMS